MAGIADMLIGGYNSGRALAKDRKAEADKSALAGLFSQGYSSGDMRSALPQIAAIDHNAAMQAGQFADQQEDRRAGQVREHARMLLSLPAHMRQQYYVTKARPSLEQIGLGDGLPDEITDDLTPTLEAIASGGQSAEQYTLAEGSARYDASGRLIAERPRAPAQTEYVFQTDRDGNGFWIPKPSGQGPTAGAPAPTTGGGAQVMDSAYQGGMGFDPLRDAVEFHESRGNPNAVSPAGAVGRMQTMPDTLTDPGFGVTPARDQSDAERTRVGNEYLQAMLQKYGSPELALAAYNWGPGNVDQALQRSGGDPRAVLASAPQETQQYVQNVMTSAGGQGAPQGAPGGAIPVPGFRGAPKGRDAPSGYQYAPDGQSLVPIPGGPADRKLNPVASDLAKGEMGLRKEVEGRVKDQRVVVDMYQKVRAAAQNPSAPNDLALIFAYMKMLDPGSVVREAEFANAQNAAGVPDQIRNVWNRAQRGERLNEDQRANFLRSASEIYDVASQAITRQTREYQGMADEYGYDPRRSTGSPDFRGVIGGSSDPAPANGDVSSMSDDDLLRALGQ